MSYPTQYQPAQYQPTPVRLKRHPIRGFVGGLLMGLGLALMVIVYGKAPFGVATPYVCIVCGVVAGLLLGIAGPPRRRR